MEELYKNEDYEALDSAIESICQDFKQTVFGEQSQVEKTEWLSTALLPQTEWLFSLDSIREKVYLSAEVEMLHINGKEAKRLLIRLRLQ